MPEMLFLHHNRIFNGTPLDCGWSAICVMIRGVVALFWAILYGKGVNLVLDSVQKVRCVRTVHLCMVELE